jgi:hypothetical protein
LLWLVCLLIISVLSRFLDWASLAENDTSFSHSSFYVYILYIFFALILGSGQPSLRTSLIFAAPLPPLSARCCLSWSITVHYSYPIDTILSTFNCLGVHHSCIGMPTANTVTHSDYFIEASFLSHVYFFLNPGYIDFIHSIMYYARWLSHRFTQTNIYGHHPS